MTAQGERPGRPAGWIVEALVVVCLAVAAASYGRAAYRHDTPEFYQGFFGPAVMVAAGQGFVNPVPASSSPLADFLGRRVDHLSIADVTTVPVVAPDQFQQATRYLMLTVGWLWRWTGVSWAAVGWVAAALHALAVLGAYGLLRLFLPMVLAGVGAAWICVSPLSLVYAPHVRDYSKGAFILAALPLIVALTLRAGALRTKLALAAITGVVIGIGAGFKMDVVVVGPIAAVCVVLFSADRPWRGLGEKAGVLAVLTFATGLALWPVVSHLSGGGSNAFHVILLGYAEQFDAALKVRPSIYRFVPYYSDDYMMHVVQVRAAADTGRWALFPSAEYDHASVAIWTDMVRRFPADVLTRAVGAADGVLNLLFAQPASRTGGAWLMPPAVAVASRGLAEWQGWGAVLGGGLIVSASIVQVRLGLFAAVLLLALAGYPSLQFDPRHYFHLQIIPVLAMLALAWLPLRSVMVAWQAWRPREQSGASLAWQPVAVRAIGVAIAMALLPAPLAAVRLYQAREVRHLLNSFLDQPRTRMDVVSESRADGTVVARWPALEDRATRPGPPAFAYYLAEFSSAPGSGPTAVALRYLPGSGMGSCPRVLTSMADGDTVRFAFPVFVPPGRKEFDGLQMGASAARRLTGVYLVKSGGPGGLPLELRLPPDWAERPLYQRLRAEGRRGDEPVVQVASTGDVACGDELPYIDLFGPNGPAPAPERVDVIYATGANVTAQSIRMDGLVEARTSYVAQFKPEDVEPGHTLLAQGHLDEGGLTIGLLKDRAWYATVNVLRAGDFAVAIPVHEPGTFMPVISNALPADHRRNRFVMTRFGFVAGPSRATEAR